jgi:hypothetical protein
MSPTERDLRAALHDGEGDGLNVDGIVSSVRSLRAQRRRRMLNTAAAVVVVAGVAAGGTALVRSATGDSTASDSAKTNNGGAASAPGGASAQRGSAYGAANGTGNGGLNSAPPPAGLPGCPASLPRYTLPGTSTPSTSAAGGRLFSGTVRSAVVCSYGSLDAALSGNAPKPTRVVLTGNGAATLAASLENAARVRPKVMCPQIRSADERSLAVIGVAADGARLGTVTTTMNMPACDVRVTNGKAVRYAWSPPPSLANRLAGANPSAGRSHGPVVNGSPTR